MLLIEQKLVCMSQQETSAIAMRKLAKQKGKDKDKDLEYTIDGKFLIYLKIKPSSVKSFIGCLLWPEGCEGNQMWEKS